MKAERLVWKDNQKLLASSRLFFIDETGIDTKMTRLRGRSPQGERLIAPVPHGHWKTSTFVAALSQEGLVAPMVVDSAMNGFIFLEYVRQVLCPELQKGDVVIMDNLSSHKVTGVREAIGATGATLLYLPPYSPDFNPIEQVFAKIKALLRKMANRTVGELWDALSPIILAFHHTECRNYIYHAGYRTKLNRKCSKFILKNC